MPADLKEEAHLMELESMGFTIVSVAPSQPAWPSALPLTDHGSDTNVTATQVHDAIPPDLLRRLRICHEQACQRIRDCKPKADWSWESDNP